MTPRQLRIIELRVKLRGWLPAKERDRLLAELARLVRAETALWLPTDGRRTMKIEIRDRIFLGDRKTPFRVASFGQLQGERAVGLMRQADYANWNKGQPVEIVRWLAVADLVRDTGRRGWRERWRQVEMGLTASLPTP